jgi:hypothetical protein
MKKVYGMYLDLNQRFVFYIGNHSIRKVSRLLVAKSPLGTAEGSLPLAAANSVGKDAKLWEKSVLKMEAIKNSIGVWANANDGTPEPIARLGGRLNIVLGVQGGCMFKFVGGSTGFSPPLRII